MTLRGKRLCLGAGLLALAALTRTATAAEGLAVHGHDRAVLALPAGIRVEPYANGGYRLEVLADGSVSVAIEAAAMRSRTPFVAPDRTPGSSPRAALARALAAGATTRYQAASRILGWVSANIAYELERSLPQDADSVLSRRSGYCTGVARLTVALLDELGIEAREVPGFVVTGGAGAVGRGFHRWVEIFYPDRGWVFSDPLVTHHYVPATYLRLASEEVLPGGEAGGRLLQRDDQVRAVDVFPGVAPGVRVRRNEDRQMASALQVLVDDEIATGVATLEGEGVRLTRAVAAGSTTFVGLRAGTYQLRLRLDRALIERSVAIPARVRQAVLVPIGGGRQLPEVTGPSRTGGQHETADLAAPVARGRQQVRQAPQH